MFVLYNILQGLLLVVFAPVIVLFVLLSPKYRDRIPNRLGFGLKNRITTKVSSCQTIWLHALSVGEVTSAFPLVTGLRREFPDSQIVVSVSTRTGKRLALDLLEDVADNIIDGPLDLLPVVSHFTNCIRPNVYILVETDFWPNIITFLTARGIPCLLVNGRVSEKSMQNYSQLAFFSRQMFQSFTYLCLQTELDKKNMTTLGVAAEKLLTLGNLKFDAPLVKSSERFESCANLIPEGSTVLVAGSTHDGEEAILLKAFKNLLIFYPRLFLVLVPRSPQRAGEILSLAQSLDMGISLRSENKAVSHQILLVDTIGELTLFYSLSDIAYVGGSLVSAGGHNPIEPAALRLPVLFGPNMQDFTEIATDLITEGGAQQIARQEELEAVLHPLIASEEARVLQGDAAYQCIQRQRGVVSRHLDLIRNLL